MSYEFYKILHFAGIVAVLLSLSAMIYGAATAGHKKFPAARFLKVAHGVGLVITLVAGFGLLARLGLIREFPGWAIAKLGIWLLFGVYSLAVYKKPKQSTLWWTGLWALAVAAAYLARMKPF